jgi:hypothetical protein
MQLVNVHIFGSPLYYYLTFGVGYSLQNFFSTRLQDVIFP